jgi:hypothetical protein
VGRVKVQALSSNVKLKKKKGGKTEATREGKSWEKQQPSVGEKGFNTAGGLAWSHSQ